MAAPWKEQQNPVSTGLVGQSNISSGMIVSNRRTTLTNVKDLITGNVGELWEIASDMRSFAHMQRSLSRAVMELREHFKRVKEAIY